MIKILTSESVNIGHPDKTCDFIADSFLDEALKQDKNAQMAVECAIKSNLLMIYGEATTTAKINYEKIAREALRFVGYKNKFKIIKKISIQSPDINQAVVKNEIMANDQGIIFGYACNETKEYMPMPILVAHQLMKKYDEFRRNNENLYFPDAKSQVSVAYDDDKIKNIDTVLISVSHSSKLTHEQIEADIMKNVIIPVLKANKTDYKNAKFIINPSGKFTIWGSFGDSGCVGRKIIVDTYGGIGRVGGGCFSSKNASKVDRSAAYYARYVAKNIVANGLADKCEIALSYGIGMAEPISVYVETFGTNKVSQKTIEEVVKNNFNFRPQNIINELNLLKPVYAKTSCFGHFGRKEFTWEKVKKLKK